MARRIKPMEICHECGAPMKREERMAPFHYRGQEVLLKQPGWWCTKCSEAILSSEDMAATEDLLKEFRAEIDGVLFAKEVARIRTRLRLSQRRAGELLGGGFRAFHKYENGEVALSAPMSNLLRLLDKDPARLKELPEPPVIKKTRGKRTR